MQFGGARRPICFLQEERREKESPADEGQGQENRQSTQGCEEGRQGCAQEGEAQSQADRQEGCTQAKAGAAKGGSPEGRSADDSGTDGNTACDAGLRAIDLAVDSQYRTVGVLKTAEGQLRRVSALAEGARRYCPGIFGWREPLRRRADARRARL